MGAQMADGAHLEGAKITYMSGRKVTSMSGIGIPELLIFLVPVVAVVAALVAVIRIGFRGSSRER